MHRNRIILALTAAAIAAPAAAQGNAPAKTSAKPAVYCIEYEKGTDSRLHKSECLTKAEWAKRGVNVDEMLKK